jgi:protein involved in polysaccharide export with SLBB domain
LILPGIVLFLTITALTGVGCRSLFHGRASQSVAPVSGSVLEAVQPPEIKPVTEIKPVAESKSVPEVTESAKSANPWYKFWGKNAARNTITGEESSPKPVVIVPPEVRAETNAMFSAHGEPLIKVGYALRLFVSAGGKTELPEQVKTVSDKGEIVLPLIGPVKCEGLTLKELSERLSESYKKYILQPQPVVDFVYTGQAGEASPWGAVMVAGSVKQPGRVNIPPTRNLTLSRALQLSGGLEKVADESSIIVTRLNRDGSMKKMVVNYLLVIKRGQRDKDIVLEPGDTVYVPESTW